MGAGHSVTALYEIALEQFEQNYDSIIATTRIRYQDAETREVIELSETITVGDLLRHIDEASTDFRMHAAAAEFAELLRESYWAREGTYSNLAAFAAQLERERPNNQQIIELVDLIRLAGRIKGDQ